MKKNKLVIFTIIAMLAISQAHSESAVSGYGGSSSGPQRIEVHPTALEKTLQGCKDDQCKVNAAVDAVKQGGSSPDLGTTLAGKIIKTVIAYNVDSSKLKQALTKEIKSPVSPS